jgi:DNA-binding IclR family transcriptional regulator
MERSLNKPLSKHTPHTITNQARLIDELSRVRDQGYSAAYEEFEIGLNAVSAPIFDHNSCVVASVSVSGPVYRVTRERIPQITTQLVQITQTITRELGCLDFVTDA